MSGRCSFWRAGREKTETRSSHLPVLEISKEPRQVVRRTCLMREPEGVGALTPAGVAFFQANWSVISFRFRKKMFRKICNFELVRMIKFAENTNISLRFLQISSTSFAASPPRSRVEFRQRPRTSSVLFNKGLQSRLRIEHRNELKFRTVLPIFASKNEVSFSYGRTQPFEFFET